MHNHRNRVNDAVQKIDNNKLFKKFYSELRNNEITLYQVKERLKKENINYLLSKIQKMIKKFEYYVKCCIYFYL